MPSKRAQRRPAPIIAIVVPCHNEQEVLRSSAKALCDLVNALVSEGDVSSESYVCFVDDGSTDDTWNIIDELSASSHHVRGLKLTRNFGHQGAVLAGMFECDADAIISIDADLQDDESRIRDMVKAYRDGYEIVLGVRDDRTSDTAFKRTTADGYYTALGWMGVDIVHNHADYRLMSRPAIEALRTFPETNLFLRGIVPLIGLPWTTVQYSRRIRVAGQSKYGLKKMLSLAWEGVTSLSVFPLRVVAAMGAIIAIGAIATGGWVLFVRFFVSGTVPGWASTVLPVYFLGGVQILCMGVIGEYVGKIYLETKRRPRYLTQERTWDTLTNRSQRYA